MRELKSLDSQAPGTTLVGPRSIAGQSLTGGRARLDRLLRPGLTVFCGDAQCGRRAGRPCARNKVVNSAGSTGAPGTVLDPSLARVSRAGAHVLIGYAGLD